MAAIRDSYVLLWAATISEEHCVVVDNLTKIKSAFGCAKGSLS
jgi:hypothetical protein